MEQVNPYLDDSAGMFSNLNLKIDQVRTPSSGMQDAHIGQLPQQFYSYVQQAQVPQRIQEFAHAHHMSADVGMPLIYQGCVGLDWMVRFTPLPAAAADFDAAAARQLMEDWRKFAADLAAELTDSGDLSLTAGTTSPAPTTHAKRAPLRSPCVSNASGTLFATSPRLADDVLLMKIVARFDGSLHEAGQAASKCQQALEHDLSESLNNAFPSEFDVEVELTGIVPLSLKPAVGDAASVTASQQYTIQFDMFALTTSEELISRPLSVAAVQVLSDAVYSINPLEPTPSEKARIQAAHAAEVAALQSKLDGMAARMEEMRLMLAVTTGQLADAKKENEALASGSAATAAAPAAAPAPAVVPRSSAIYADEVKVAGGPTEAKPPAYNHEDAQRRESLSKAKLQKNGLPIQLLKEPWFNDWNREQTEQNLLGAGAEDGLFAVRQSGQEPDKVVVSVCKGRKVNHHLVVVAADTWKHREYCVGDFLTVFHSEACRARFQTPLRSFVALDTQQSADGPAFKPVALQEAAASRSGVVRSEIC